MATRSQISATKSSRLLCPDIPLCDHSTLYWTVNCLSIDLSITMGDGPQGSQSRIWKDSLEFFFCIQTGNQSMEKKVLGYVAIPNSNKMTTLLFIVDVFLSSATKMISLLLTKTALEFMTRGGNDGRVLRSGQHWIARGQPWHLHRASSPVKPFSLEWVD